MKLRNRILILSLPVSLAVILFLSIMFFVAVAGLRRVVLDNSARLGDRAAGISSRALEDQLVTHITRIATDMALLLDEKLLKIENHTRMTADTAGTIYSHWNAWRPQNLPRVESGEIPPNGPYLHFAPGIDPARIRQETATAGNIGTLLRQITVVNQGINTSTIGGESGYVIAMDASPWPLTDFDPRLQPWYHGAVERGGLFWTGIHADLRGRGPAFSCAMPFYDRSGPAPVLKGVARSTVLLSGFAGIFDSAGAGRGGWLFLLDGSGRKLISSGRVDVSFGAGGAIRGENYLESGSPALRDLGGRMTGGSTGTARLEMAGVQVYVAYAPLRSLGWSLGAAVPASEITDPARHIGDRILAFAGEAMTGMDRRILFLSGLFAAALFVSLFVTAFLSLRFSLAITRPIMALNEGVHELGGGRLDGEVSIKTGDELEELADSFNAMTVKLREQIAETAKASAQKERIATELDVATQIQKSLLPGSFPPFPGKKNLFDLYAAVYPAREVGGDFYDFFFIDDDHFAVLAGDVSGNGIPAALFMAITKTLVKNYLQNGETPEEALGKVNRQLCGNNAAGMFVTLWLGVLELSDMNLDFVNAGHNPPFLDSGGTGFDILVSTPSLFLAGMEDTVYRRRRVRLRPGDTLILYTDGITEAEDGAGRFYGRERMRNCIEAKRGLPLRELLEGLYGDIMEFGGGAVQHDDITMLALRLVPENPASRSIEIPASTERLEELEAFITETLDGVPVPPKVRRQIELVAEEVFVNISRYAYPEGASGTVTVRCGVERYAAGAEFLLGFADRGEPFNPLAHRDPDITLPLEARAVGGLGILIMKRMMDTIDYRHADGMNRLFIRKSWREDDPAAETGSRSGEET